MKIKFFFTIFVLTFFLTSYGNNVHALVTPKPVLKGGLVGYWSFDTNDMSGTIAYDKSGQGFNGALKNITATSSVSNGKIGQGIRVGNTTGYISYGDVFDMGTNSMTLSLWVKSNALTGGTYGLMNKSLLGNQNGRYFLAVDSNVFIGGFEGSGGQVTVTTSVTPYNDNNFHMVTLVYNRTGNMTLYVDGVNKGASSISSQSGSNMQTSDTFLIGKYNDGSGGETGTLTVNATLDDARVYNRALSATEVATLYKETVGKVNATSATTKLATGSNSPIAHWTFDGINMTNATATDITGNGNNGALVSMTTTANAVSGKIGQALYFNGSSYINAGTNALVGTGPVTISMWIKPTASGVYSLGSFLIGATGLILYDYSSDLGNNTPMFGFRTTGNEMSGTAGSIVNNQWQHLVFVYNGNGVSTASNFAIYRNGVSQTVTKRTLGIGGSQTTNYIGSDNGASAFPGSIDDVRIYNRELSASEISKLYTAGGGKANVSATQYISNGLVGYWTFDGKNMTNSTAIDSSSSGNTGTLTNMTTTANAIKGKIGQALNFIGANSTYISNGSNIITGNSARSISYWAKGTGTDKIAVGLGTAAGGTANAAFAFAPQSSTSANIYGGTAPYDESAISLSLNLLDGNWHHIVVTWDALNTGTLNIYGDGALIGTRTRSAGAAYNTQGGIIIGNWYDFNRYFSGSIDDVRVYNRALSPAEVLTLYKLGGK